ncbi:hypothetical protein F4680DRAFT_464904 [Xylaria scruposa]|nr:hypothetical protein F4680DRAFT_464904 [Xylaria scruposa]
MADVPSEKTEIHGLVQRYVGNSGVGLCAAYAIARGRLLLVEPILFSVQTVGTAKDWVPEILKQYEKLSHSARRDYLSLMSNVAGLSAEFKDVIRDTLHESCGEEPTYQTLMFNFEVVGIFLTNARPLDTEMKLRSGIFLRASSTFASAICFYSTAPLPPGAPDQTSHIFVIFDHSNPRFLVGFNHSCSPNAFAKYCSRTRKAYVHAITNIEQGEEARISYYSDYIFPHDVRAKVLQFDCDCWACQIQNRESSDARRRRIEFLSTKAHEYVTRVSQLVPDTPPIENAYALDDAEEFIRLLFHERLFLLLEVGYERLASCYIHIGQKQAAERSIRLAEKHNLICYGRFSRKKHQLWELLSRMPKT